MEAFCQSSPTLPHRPSARMKEVNGMSWKINTHAEPYYEAFPKVISLVQK